MLKKISYRSLGILAAVVLTCLFFYQAFTYWIYPTIFLDEAYYAGAVVKLLHGDFFLRTYSFDKPFLHPWLVAAGVLIAGESPVGFKFAGMIFLLASILLFLAMSYRILSKTLHQFWAILIAAAASVAFFFDHTMMVFGVGVFAEAFVIFFLLMWTRSLLKRPAVSSGDKVPAGESIWFFLALCTKPTALFWGSALLFAWWPFQFQNLKRRAKSWLFWGWPFIAALIFFMLTNRQKLAPLKMTASNSFGHEKASIFERVIFWFQELTIQGRWPLALTILATIVLLGLMASGKTRQWLKKHLWNERMFWICNVAALVHFAGIILSGAPLINRYLCILIPQVGLGLIFFIANIGAIRSRVLKNGALAVITLVLISIGVSHLKEETKPLVPNLAWGRTLQQLPHRAYSGFFHTNFAWEIYPFSTLHEYDNYSSCYSAKCLAERRQGRPVDSSQYLFLQDPNGIQLWQAPLVWPTSEKSQCRSVEIQKSEPLAWEAFEASLNDFTRMRGGTKWQLLDDVKATQVAAKPAPEFATKSPWVNLNDGQLLTFEVAVNPGVTLQIKALLIATGDSLLLKKEALLSASYAGLLVQSLVFKEKGWDLTDLTPLIWHSYFLPVKALPFEQTAQNRILRLHYAVQEGQLKLTEERVQDRAACLP